MEYIFTLKYRLAEQDRDVAGLEKRLLEAGCDDALLGFGYPGRIALEFTREANGAEEAVRTALSDVRQALPAAQLIEASPDLVGLSDVAERVGVSRWLQSRGNYGFAQDVIDVRVPRCRLTC